MQSLQTTPWRPLGTKCGWAVDRETQKPVWLVLHADCLVWYPKRVILKQKFKEKNNSDHSGNSDNTSSGNSDAVNDDDRAMVKRVLRFSGIGQSTNSHGSNLCVREISPDEVHRMHDSKTNFLRRKLGNTGASLSSSSASNSSGKPPMKHSSSHSSLLSTAAAPLLPSFLSSSDDDISELLEEAAHYFAVMLNESNLSTSGGLSPGASSLAGAGAGPVHTHTHCSFENDGQPRTRAVFGFSRQESSEQWISAIRAMAALYEHDSALPFPAPTVLTPTATVSVRLSWLRLHLKHIATSVDLIIEKAFSVAAAAYSSAGSVASAGTALGSAGFGVAPSSSTSAAPPNRQCGGMTLADRRRYAMLGETVVQCLSGFRLFHTKPTNSLALARLADGLHNILDLLSVKVGVGGIVLGSRMETSVVECARLVQRVFSEVSGWAGEGSACSPKQIPKATPILTGTDTGYNSAPHLPSGPPASLPSIWPAISAGKISNIRTGYGPPLDSSSGQNIVDESFLDELHARSSALIEAARDLLHVIKNIHRLSVMPTREERSSGYMRSPLRPEDSVEEAALLAALPATLRDAVVLDSAIDDKLLEDGRHVEAPIQLAEMLREYAQEGVACMNQIQNIVHSTQCEIGGHGLLDVCDTIRERIGEVITSARSLVADARAEHGKNGTVKRQQLQQSLPPLMKQLVLEFHQGIELLSFRHRLSAAASGLRHSVAGCNSDSTYLPSTLLLGDCSVKLVGQLENVPDLVIERSKTQLLRGAKDIAASLKCFGERVSAVGVEMRAGPASPVDQADFGSACIRVRTVGMPVVSAASEVIAAQFQNAFANTALVRHAYTSAMSIIELLDLAFRLASVPQISRDALPTHMTAAAETDSPRSSGRRNRRQSGIFIARGTGALPLVNAPVASRSGSSSLANAPVRASIDPARARPPVMTFGSASRPVARPLSPPAPVPVVRDHEDRLSPPAGSAAREESPQARSRNNTPQSTYWTRADFETLEKHAFEEEPPDPQHVIVEIDEDTRTETVKSATLNSLIQRLTSAADFPDQISYQKTFVTTYRSFTTPRELFVKLRQRYNVLIPRLPPGVSRDEYERKNVTPVQLRTVNILKMWIETSYDDFASDELLLERIRVYLDDRLPADGKEPYSRAIRNAMQKRQLQFESTQERDSLSNVGDTLPVGRRIVSLIFTEVSLNVQESDFELLSPTALLQRFSEDALAQQLALLDMAVYSQIRPVELLHLHWTKESTRARSPNVVQMIERFNALSGWAASVVLWQQALADRSLVFEKLVRLAERLRFYGCFNGCLSIVAGLNNAAIFRLNHTKAGVSAAVATMLGRLNALLDSNQSYKAYRTAIKQVNPPCVPYLGVYLTDLTFIEEGNKDDINGLINFRKRRLVSAVLQEVQLYQLQRYSRFAPNYQLLEILHSPPHLPNDDVMYNLSLKREPRGGDRSNIL